MKIFALAAAATLIAGTASAATTGFSLGINGNNNTPTLTLENTGDMGKISGITVSIGDLAYNFDAAYQASATSGSFGFTLGSDLDTATGGGLRADSASYKFTDFGSTEKFQFKLDIDIDNKNSMEDYVLRLLPKGSVFVTFEGGLVDSLFADLTPTAGNNSEPYFYAVSETLAPVPLPAGLPLLVLGLGALGLVRRARRT